MNNKLLMILMLFTSFSLTSRDNIEQSSKLHLNDGKESYSLLLQFNTLGHNMLLAHQQLEGNTTGFKELDRLNKFCGGRLVAYEQLRLKILFNTQLLKKKGISFNDLVDKYRKVKGEGKFWKLQSDTNNQVSESVRKIWLYLTPSATQLFTGDRRANLFETHVTGIKNLDELNDIHRGLIINIFFTGEDANLTFVIEFAHAVSETVLNEYRSLKEIAKVEND